MRKRREWLADTLRNETAGGVLLLAAATTAVVIANSPWSAAYEDLANFEIGPEALHLRLSLQDWAADGLLAVFFFVAGLELKYELVRGSLKHFATAIVPAASALGGMIVPALIFLGINLAMPGGEPGGWGIPLATDIAFALAVLAVFGRTLPLPLRAFLLTLAIVDDLGAILVIAIFYSGSVNLIALLGAAVACALFGFAQKRRITSGVVYVPLALIAWVLMHTAGIHATVAGVILGLLMRVRPDPGEEEAPAERMQHVLHPWSAGVCVPLFAFFAAGVTITGLDVGELVSAPVSLGILVGLVVGKPLGVVGAAWLVTRFSSARLRAPMRMKDVAAIGVLAGIGFTVSLLIAQLAFAPGSDQLAEAKVAILLASVVATALSALALAGRNRHHGPPSG
ncbi:MAG: Na+/H+ antiporter NhaA [Candidatus Nanopelagicales bacterium]|nr:Na+/H+ antiporter NhaA [Candidatus Nanopelagicales bacterium]